MQFEAFTKRGFRYQVELNVKPTLPFRGVIEILGVKVRCFYDEVLVDLVTGERIGMIKIFWSDAPVNLRSIYGLKTGQTLYLSLPVDKLSFIQSTYRIADPEIELIFERVA